MKKRFGFFRFATCSLFATMLFSCTGIDLGNLDDPSIHIDQSLVIPVGYAKQNAKQVLQKLKIDSLKYDSSEIAIEWSDSTRTISVKPFDINRISKYDKKINLLSGLYPANVEVPITILETFDVGVQKEKNVNVRVDSLKIKHTTLDIKLTTSNHSLNIKDFTIQFTFPNSDTIRFHNPNDNIKQPFQLEAWNVSKLITTDAYDLLLNGKERLPYYINIKFKPSATTVISPSDSIRLDIKFSDIESEVAYGKFDFQYNSEKFVKIPFDLDKIIPDANLRNITFADPRFIITATNNAGMNFDATLNHVKVYRDGEADSGISAEFVNGTTKSPSTTVSIDGPAIYKASSITILPTFNAKNGGTDNFVNRNPLPNMINYNFSISSNNSNRIANNFISPDSKITFNTKVQIPLYFKPGFSQYYDGVIDSTALKSIPDTILTSADSALVVLNIKNGFPLKGLYHMTFWKSDPTKSLNLSDTIPTIGGIVNTIENNLTKGTLTDNYIINPPELNSDGTFKSATNQTIYIGLSKEQLKALNETLFIAFKMYLSDKDKNEISQTAHITTDCFFEIKLGVYLKANTTINQK